MQKMQNITNQSRSLMQYHKQQTNTRLTYANPDVDQTLNVMHLALQMMNVLLLTLERLLMCEKNMDFELKHNLLS